MKKQMEEILNGKFKYEVPKLIISSERIDVLTKEGCNPEGEWSIHTEEDEKIRGYVVSSHRRFIPAIEQFAGKSIHIPYGVDVSGLHPGESFEGEVTLLTNVGEYKIPFSVAIEANQMKTSAGNIRSLEEFAQLAAIDYREAFHLFTTRGFEKIIDVDDDRTMALYRGLTVNPVTYQHLEEFLIGIDKKQPVRISLKEDHNTYCNLKENIQESFVITRDGWGHVRLELEAEGNFIHLNKRTVCEDDFIGSRYEVEFVLLYDAIPAGRHRGRIRVKSAYETLTYEITATRNPQVQVDINLVEKKHRASLMKEYLAYKNGDLKMHTWARQALEKITELEEAGCDYPVYQIYKALLLGKTGHVEEADRILKRFQNRKYKRQDLELAGAYLYVASTIGILKDKVYVLKNIRSYYQQKEESFLLLWMLLQLDEALADSHSRCLYMMERQYEIGCRSPLLYMAAFNLLTKDVSLLSEASDFWIQVLLYGAKQKRLTQEMCMRIAYLSGYTKSFHESLYLVLCHAYEAYEETETLEAICRMLMRSGRKDRSFFKWFQLAVDRNLRLTGLFECYVDCMDPTSQTVLPKNLKIYFAYNNDTLPDDKKAMLYANVIRHKSEDRESYENYKDKILEFARVKLKQGRMNVDYAAIYQACASRLEEPEEQACLAEEMFTYRLYCEDKRIRKVIVRHAAIAREEEFYCTNGVAYPKIYTKDAVLLFQDEKKHRYYKTVDYNLRQLFDYDIILEHLPAEARIPGFLLARCQYGIGNRILSDRELKEFEMLSRDQEMTEQYRNRIQNQLLEYYWEHKDDASVERSLRHLDYIQFAGVDQKRLLELLIYKGMYRKAYILFCEYGGEHVDQQLLLTMCSRMIMMYEFEEDEELVSLAYDIFAKGKFDEIILYYLTLYYRGPITNMIHIWKRAKGFDADTYRLSERILLLMMYAEDYCLDGVNVLEDYIRQKGNDKVIMAYLTFRAYGYFVKRHPLTVLVMQCLESAYINKRKMDQVCRLALFQALTEQKERSQKQMGILRELMQECYEKQMIFAFFSKLPKDLLTAYQLDDKIFVECTAAPEVPVVLHYALDAGLGQPLVYRSEPVRSVYPGIYTKAFTLFYGETLHYYFVKGEGDAQTATSPGKVQVKVPETGEMTKYQMLNGLLEAKKAGKPEEFMKKMQEYLCQEQYVKHVFTLEKGGCHE